MPDTRLTHVLEAYEARLSLVQLGSDPKLVKMKKALYGAMWFIENVLYDEPDRNAMIGQLKELAKEAQHG